MGSVLGHRTPPSGRWRAEGGPREPAPHWCPRIRGGTLPSRARGRGMIPAKINIEKKNGRTRTAAKGTSQMGRRIALKAADFKAGVAIPTHFGDGDDNFTQLPPF